MSDIAVEGAELKKLVNLARKQPLAFAFNPGVSEDDHLFAIHRKRSAKSLAKEAKAEGAGKKVAYGTCAVEDGCLRLRCEALVPGMEKALKKFLKANQIPLTVEVLRADDVAAGDDDDGAAATEARSTDDAVDASAAADAGAAIIARVKDVKSRITGAPKPEADRLAKAMQQVVAQIKVKNLAKAAQFLDQIEGALAQLDAGSPAPAADEAELQPVDIDDEDGDDAPEIALSDAELRKMIKLTRKRPMPFAFNAGESVEDFLFVIHRKRSARALAKIVKAQGATRKVAFGSCAVDGRVMRLTCEAVVPSMARSMKRFLKAKRLPMNVEILRGDGSVVDADIEDLSDQPDPLDDIDTADGAGDAPVHGASRAQIAARLKELAARAGSLEEPHNGRLSKAIQSVAALVKAGELAKAEQGLDKLARAIDAVPVSDGDTQGDPKEAAYRQLFDAMEADALAALRENRFADEKSRAEFQKLWDWGNNNAADGSFDKAAAALTRARGLLDAAMASPGSDFAVDVPDDVKPFAISRLNWKNTLGSMNAEMTRLQDAIRTACADDPDLVSIADSVGELTGYLSRLDERLADKLDEVVNAEPGDRRETLKGQARVLLAEYESELESDFFRVVDGQNGFTDVAIASRASAALADIRSVLS